MAAKKLVVFGKPFEGHSQRALMHSRIPLLILTSTPKSTFYPGLIFIIIFLSLIDFSFVSLNLKKNN